MAYADNLVPNEMRTPEQRRENARKAGKASAAAYRRRKAMRENMEMLLNLPPGTVKDFNKLAKAGFEIEGIDNAQLVVLALFNKAKAGDINAIKELFRLIGEDKKETEQIKLLKAQQEELKRQKGEDTTKQINENMLALADILQNPVPNRSIEGDEE